MYIALIGNNHFGPILAKQLNAYDKINQYKFFDTNQSYLDKILFTLSIFLIDRVYSIGASLNGGGALNLALKFNKKIIQHFIGSDILLAQQDFKNKNVNHYLIEKSTFLCEVTWIKEELKAIDIVSKIQALMVYENLQDPQKFQNFSILTYIVKGKETFYGINDFIKLAQYFPELEFKIAGLDKYKSMPSNIKCLGWINMLEEIQHSTVFIRNVAHDGLAFSIIESLGLGRITFYNYDFPYVQSFNNYTELEELLFHTQEQYNKGQLNLNKEGISFVKEHFNKHTVLNGLTKVLCE